MIIIRNHILCVLCEHGYNSTYQRICFTKRKKKERKQLQFFFFFSYAKLNKAHFKVVSLRLQFRRQFQIHSSLISLRTQQACRDAVHRMISPLWKSFQRKVFRLIFFFQKERSISCIAFPSRDENYVDTTMMFRFL